MGSFMGHVVPGTFFCLFGIWWMLSCFRRYFLCLRSVQQGRSPYRSTCTFPSSCCPKIPVEGILKVIAVIIGMTGEFITAFENGVFTHIGNAQHMTMFFFFGLTGVMDIVLYYKLPVPHDVDYISAVLAFGMEGLLFYHHLHGRTPMDVQVHMLLFNVIMCCVLATGAEMRYRTNVLPALCRIFFTLLQGTWFFQVGFILYPPTGNKWTEHDHEQMMIVTLIFCWHCAAIFVFMTLSGTLVYLRVRAMSPTSLYHTLNPLTRSENNHVSKLDTEQVRHIIADSEEEL